jgi:hypothetical protein
MILAVRLFLVYHLKADSLCAWIADYAKRTVPVHDLLQGLKSLQSERLLTNNNESTFFLLTVPLYVLIVSLSCRERFLPVRDLHKELPALTADQPSHLGTDTEISVRSLMEGKTSRSERFKRF